MVELMQIKDLALRQIRKNYLDDCINTEMQFLKHISTDTAKMLKKYNYRTELIKVNAWLTLNVF